MGRKLTFWRRKDGTLAVEFVAPVLLVAAIVALLVYVLVLKGR